MVEKEITIEIKNPEILALVIILLVFFVSELNVTFNNPIVFGDEGFHARIAQLISKNVEYYVWSPVHYTKLTKEGFSRPPLLNILIASFLLLFGGSEALINFLIPFMAFLTGSSAFFLGKELYNKETGFITAIIAGSIPAFVTYSVLIYTDILVTLFITLFFLFFVLGIKREKTVYFIISGVFGAFTFLTKTSGIAVYMFFFLAFLYQIILKRKYNLIKKYFILFIVMTIILTPYFLRNLYYYKTPICDFPYAGKFFDISGCSVREYEEEYKYEEEPQQVGTEQSVYRLGITNYLNFAYGGLDVLGIRFPWVILGVFSGLFILLSKKRMDDVFVLLMLSIFLLIFYYAPGRAEDVARYTLAWTPFIALLAGKWFSEIYEFIKKYQKYLALIVFAVVIVLSYLNLQSKLDVMAQVKQFSPLFFEASDWIKENLPEDVTLSTIWGHRAVYTTERNAIGRIPDIYLSRDETYTRDIAKKLGVTHLFIQKFSISDQNIAEHYRLDSIQFFEDNPETFIKVYENGPPLEQCLQQGGCDGNIIYEINYDTS